MNRFAFLLAASAAMVAAAPATAQTTSYTFTAANGTTGSFLINQTAGSFVVDSVAGLINGQTITGLSSYAGADNTFNPAVPHFSFAGLSVSTGTSGDYNFYFDGTTDNLLNSLTAPTGDPGSEPFSPITTEVVVSVGAPGAVPEPATWGMMLLGFGAAGYAMRRRTKVRTNVSFA